MTTHANVDVAYRWLEALSAGPEQARAAVEEMWDADADFYPVPKAPEPGPAHGIAEITNFMMQFQQPFARHEFQPIELIPVGDDRVLIHSMLYAEGRGSGLNVGGDLYLCLWLRHGTFIRVENHVTLDRALHALGLTADDLAAHRNLRAAHWVVAGVESLDADRLIELSDPEIEWQSAFAAAGTGTVTGLPYRGHDGLRQYVSDMNDAWDVVRLAVEHEFCLGDLVIFVGQINYRGKTSGVAGESRAGYALEFRDGKLISFRPFREPEKALASVGL